jgi:hypothetical protein
MDAINACNKPEARAVRWAARFHGFFAAVRRSVERD